MFEKLKLHLASVAAYAKDLFLLLKAIAILALVAYSTQDYSVAYLLTHN